MATAKNQRELAAALGKSQPAINKWLKHPRWNLGKGPWEVDQVKSWTAKTLGASSAPPKPAAAKQTRLFAATDPQNPLESLDVKLRMELLLKQERAKLLKFQRELQEGKYVLRSAIELDRLSRIQAVKSGLDQLPRLAPRLVGMAEPQIAIVLEAEVVKLLHAFSRQPEAESA